MLAGSFNNHLGGACPECGVNRGAKSSEHVCNPKQYLAYQQTRWANEIRTKLEPDLQNYLASPRGQFTSWLIDQKKL